MANTAGILRKGPVLLLVYVALLLLPAVLAPLIGSTEARYAEIAREMMASGNYLEPYFNGIKHFHKPPLTYWLVACGMKIFGQNVFGARFFGVVAAASAVIFLYRLAQLLLADEYKASLAAMIFASSILFLAEARVVSTEIYLTCCTIAAQYYLFRQIYGEKQTRNAIFYALFLAFGFLCKGPIIFLFTLLPFVAAKALDRAHHAVFTRREIAIGIGVFLAVSLPWYLAVVAKNPGLLHYFLKIQVVDRVITDRFHRYRPPWFFLYVLPVTFVPWILFFLKGLFRMKDLPLKVRVLLVYVVAPLVIFSVAMGKHATYILPFYGVLAIYTAEVFTCFAMPRLRQLALAVAALLAIAPAVASFVVPELAALRLPFFIASFSGAGLAWLVFRYLRTEQFLIWTAAALIFFSIPAHTAFVAINRERNAYEEMVASLDALDPAHSLPIMVYTDFLPSISFYRGQLATMALCGKRETQFQPEESYRGFYLETAEDVEKYLRTRPRLFVVMPPRFLDFLKQRFHLRCNSVFRQQKFSAYLCKLDGTFEPPPAISPE
jgi:4-amino-4-deoxy-L-arabinose transferase-like glycosyltransferase